MASSNDPNDPPFVKGQAMGFLEFLDETNLPPELKEDKKSLSRGNSETKESKERDKENRDGEEKEKKVKAQIANNFDELPIDVQKNIKKNGIEPEDVVGKNYEILLNVLRFCTKQTFKMDKNHPRELEKQVHRSTRSISPVPESIETESHAPPSLLMKTDEAISTLQESGIKKVFKNMEFSGKGGFGKVFFAIQNADKQQVAVKKMPHQTEKEILANLSEIGYLKQCVHPNIVKFLNAYKFKKEAWLIMEFMEGGTLNEAVKNFEFKETHIAFVALEMLKGIKYLHDKKFAHRDLKSSNVMMTVQGEVKLIDFGLCVDVSSGPKHHMLGSPFWMPPEMIQGKSHDSCADLWSFGVCMLEMINRSPPYKDSKMKCIYTAATEGFDKVINSSNCSAELKDFMSSCLKVDPKDRAPAGVLLQHSFLQKADTRKTMEAIISSVFLSKSMTSGGLI